METTTKVTSRVRIMLPLPDINKISPAHLMTLENMRQAQFDVMVAFLKGCYMKYDCKDIITGGTFQSRSGIEAESVKELNTSEVMKTVRGLGFTVTDVASDWRDKIKKD